MFFSSLTWQLAFWKAVLTCNYLAPVIRRVNNLFIGRCIGRVIYVEREGAVPSFHSRSVTRNEVRVSHALGGGILHCARGHINCDLCPSRKKNG